jgi:hypothetical protein
MRMGVVSRLYKAGRYLPLMILMLSLISVAFAQNQAQNNIRSALQTLCFISQTVMGAAVMVLIVLAGVTYAIGQILGAETRARATVWATAMLTGAVIGAIIYLVGPAILAILFGYGLLGQQFYWSYAMGNICQAIAGIG